MKLSLHEWAVVILGTGLLLAALCLLASCQREAQTSAAWTGRFSGQVAGQPVDVAVALDGQGQEKSTTTVSEAAIVGAVQTAIKAAIKAAAGGISGGAGGFDWNSILQGGSLAALTGLLGNQFLAEQRKAKRDREVRQRGASRG